MCTSGREPDRIGCRRSGVGPMRPRLERSGVLGHILGHRMHAERAPQARTGVTSCLVGGACNIGASLKGLGRPSHGGDMGRIPLGCKLEVMTPDAAAVREADRELASFRLVALNPLGRCWLL
jgi:hypothetical protein